MFVEGLVSTQGVIAVGAPLYQLDTNMHRSMLSRAAVAYDAPVAAKCGLSGPEYPLCEKFCFEGNTCVLLDTNAGDQYIYLYIFIYYFQ